MARIESQVKGGYYPTPMRVAHAIGEFLHCSGQHNYATPKFIDPTAGDGEPLAAIATAYQKHLEQSFKDDGQTIQTYGIEIDTIRAKTTEQNLNHVLAYDTFQTTVSSQRFHFMLLNPPYDYDADDQNSRTELHFLRHCTNYLIQNGVVAYIIPRNRLRAAANYLSTHYTNLTVYNFPEPEVEDFNQIVIFGNRSKVVPPQQALQQTNYLNAVVDGYQTIKAITDTGYVQHRVNVPSVWQEEDSHLDFQTRYIDPHELHTTLRSAGNWTDPTIQIHLWPDGVEIPRPLTSLRTGHLGLFLASGVLNNHRLEVPGRNPILVKGRMTKSFKEIEVTEDREVQREQLDTSITLLDLVTGETQEIS